MFLPQPNQIVDVFIIIDRAGNYPVGNQLITTVLLLVKPFADSKIVCRRGSRAKGSSNPKAEIRL